jgi:hypothetical protein
MVKVIEGTLLQKNQLVRVKANREYFDPRFQMLRKVGQMWDVEVEGYYLPATLDEIPLEILQRQIINVDEYLRIEATEGHYDEVFQCKRKIGEQWNVTSQHLNAGYHCTPQQRLLQVLKGNILEKGDYCLIEEEGSLPTSLPIVKEGYSYLLLV